MIDRVAVLFLTGSALFGAVLLGEPVPAASAVRPGVPPVQPAVATNWPLFPTPPMGQPRLGATSPSRVPNVPPNPARPGNR
jgi:hypothetical protein